MAEPKQRSGFTQAVAGPVRQVWRPPRAVLALIRRTALALSDLAADCRRLRALGQQPVVTEAGRHDAIEHRAYALWQARGSAPGSDKDDWLAAEWEVDRELHGHFPTLASHLSQAGPAEGVEKSLKDRLEDLVQAANTSAIHTNASFLTFMFVLTYVALAIGSTTDEQLLRVSSLTMPLVGIKLPVVGFFVVAPYLVVLLHLNLLLQLYLLSRPLHALDGALASVPQDPARKLYRLRLFPLPFTHFLIGREPRRLVRFFVWISVVATVMLLPLALVTSAQIRFLPYHDATVSNTQRIAVWLDALFLLFLWPHLLRCDQATLVHRVGVQPEPTQHHPWIVSVYCLVDRAIARTRLRMFVLVFPLFASFVAVAPGEAIETRLAGEWPYSSLTHWFRRNLSLRETVLLAKEPDTETLAAIEGSDTKEQNNAIKKVVGLGLAARNLSNADLNAALLSKADLREADLQGADLSGADLQGADLRNARIGGALFDDASLCLADLKHLVRTPLTRKGFANIQRYLDHMVADPVLRDRVLQRIAPALDRQDDIEWARDVSYAFCGSSLPFGCWDSEGYDSRLATYLGRLGCGNGHIRLGLAKRTLLSAGEESNRSLGLHLAEMLVAPTCNPEGSPLPDDLKRALDAIRETR
jgi:hypothetical protein